MKKTITFSVRNFPAELNKAFRVEAVKQGTSVEKLAVVAIEDFLKKQAAK